MAGAAHAKPVKEAAAPRPAVAAKANKRAAPPRHETLTDPARVAPEAAALPDWRSLARAPSTERQPLQATRPPEAAPAEELPTRAAPPTDVLVPVVPVRPAAQAPAAGTAPLPSGPERAQSELPLLRRAASPMPARGPPVADARAHAAHSRGQALPAPLRSRFEQAWRADFSAVVIHTDAEAACAAAELDALAFALGTHVYFAAGQWHPDTAAGRDLLAHELAHTLQFLRGQLHDTTGLSAPGDAAELAADRFVGSHPVAWTLNGPTNAADPASDTTPAVARDTVEDPQARPYDARAPPQAPVLRRTTDGARQFFSQGHFQQAAQWATASQSLDAELATDAAADAQAMPAPTARLGPDAPVPPPVPAPAAPLVLEGDIPLPTSEASPDLANGSTELEVAAPDWPGRPTLRPGADGDTDAMEAQLGQALDQVPTTFDLDTSPGEPPAMTLDGAADPAQALEQQAAAAAMAQSLAMQAGAAVEAGPGPEQVQAASLHETHAVEAAVGTEVLEPLPAIAEMDRLMAAPIPEEVRITADQQGQARMQDAMAEAEAQLQSADAEHEAQRSAEVVGAQTEEARLNAEAEAAQTSEVTRARGQIDDARASTRQAQAEAVDGLQQQASDGQASMDEELAARVQADEQAVTDRYDEAEREAQAAQHDAEAQAEQKRAEAEHESEDQSWWESALDAIGDFFDALVDFVNQVFDALISAVGALIDAAKAFASGLISALRDFAVALVQAYGALLKGLVDALLADLFPSLAAALTSAIDVAVALATTAINWVADQLEQGLLALLDAIGAALTRLLEAYRAAVTMALRLAQAGLTGDWTGMARAVIEAALTIVGIDPAEFFLLIETAAGAFEMILEDVGAFVGHVIGGVALGFQLFADHFLTHLQNGFFEWLVGPLGELSITLPESWDLPGLLGLVLQVLGLTQDGIRTVVTEELGETAGVVFDHVWRYVGALIEGGVAGLWQEISNDLGMLWDTVVEGIKSWLLETVVMQAVVQLASMFNPVGALLQALLTVWNLYQWLRENAERIWGIVEAVVTMMASLAAGVLEPAALAIEAALADLVPVAISLLAHILRLGGITAKVREVLESLRETVRNAIRNLIRRVRGVFGGGVEGDTSAPEADGDAATFDPRGLRTVRFSVTGSDGSLESHEVFYVVGAATASMRVASEGGEPVAKAVHPGGELAIVDGPEERRAVDHASMGEAATARVLQADAEPAVHAQALADANAELTQTASALESGAAQSDPVSRFSTELAAMPTGSRGYATDQLEAMPADTPGSDWTEIKTWLLTRSGFVSFMGENSRVGRDDSVPILRDAAQTRLTALANGPPMSGDVDSLTTRAKPKVQAPSRPYEAVHTAMLAYLFGEGPRANCETEADAAFALPENEDVRFVTNTLRAIDEDLIDRYDAAILPMVSSGEIRGNAEGLRNQFNGLLRSSNGLKYLFASGFRLQMERIITAAVRPTRLHGVEVSIAARRADYTEWMEADLVTVVEVKNWGGQANWTPAQRVDRVAEMQAQVEDHLGALRSGRGPDAAPIGGVRVEIRSVPFPEVDLLVPVLDTLAASSPTVIPGRFKQFRRLWL